MEVSHPEGGDVHPHPPHLEAAVLLTGVASRIVVFASGDAVLNSAFPAVDAGVEASGASHVTARASDTLRVRASGESLVTVLGAPATRDVETSGTARVVFEE